ncbi:MAG: hypothetical protein EOP84_20755 [Verrucomicrobiaceae bacterium]|nr:MAG: hypothetical protein EOP84_20755 [Verrucomicrobiaceae bacterium]
MTEGPAYVFRARAEVKRCFYLQGYRLSPNEFRDKIDEVTLWCIDQFGQHSDRWDVNYGRNWVQFQDDIAATAFKIRWC